MKPSELLNVKTGILFDAAKVHDKDSHLLDDDLFALPRVIERVCSGAAGFCLIFEYTDLDQAKALFDCDVKSAEAILLKYEERYDSYTAHPDIDGGSPCCGGYGKNRDEFNDLTWSIDERKYVCIECEAIV